MIYKSLEFFKNRNIVKQVQLVLLKILCCHSVIFMALAYQLKTAVPIKAKTKTII